MFILNFRTNSRINFRINMFILNFRFNFRNVFTATTTFGEFLSERLYCYANATNINDLIFLGFSLRLSPLAHRLWV